MEDISIRNLYSKIDALASEVKFLRGQTGGNIVLARIEQLCHELKCSIIDVNLKAPDVIVFRRYLWQLTNGGEIMYAASLLRQCWRHAFPQSLLDAPVKPLPQENLLDMALSRYPGDKSDCSAEDFNEKYHSLHAKLAAKNCDLSFHRDILKELHSIIAEVGFVHSIAITPDFLSYRAIISPMSQAQLASVFDVLVSESCTRLQDKEAFLASFDSAIQARQSQVCWLATNPKNKTINYAKLYVLFQILQVELSESAKSVIAETFVAADGSALKPFSIKSRESTAELQAFRDKLANALL